MTAEDTLQIVLKIRLLCEQSVDSSEFTEDAHAKNREFCDELRKSGHYKIWAAALMLVIEDFDDMVDLTVGYPGDFGHALESAFPEGLEAYSKLLVDSMKRKPTGLIVGLAGRLYRHLKEDCGFGLEVFQSVLLHPSANIAAKEIAEMELEP